MTPPPIIPGTLERLLFLPFCHAPHTPPLHSFSYLLLLFPTSRETTPPCPHIPCISPVCSQPTPPKLAVPCAPLCEQHIHTSPHTPCALSLVCATLALHEVHAPTSRYGMHTGKVSLNLSSLFYSILNLLVLCLQQLTGLPHFHSLTFCIQTTSELERA
jgi:hypothetical protein